MKENRIGIVGGGQLGRMMTEAAEPLGFDVTVVDPTPDCPAKQAGAEQIEADLTDGDAIVRLGELADHITWEIEHIDTETLLELVEQGKNVQPSPETLNLIKDKLRQKQFLSKEGIPVADYLPVVNREQLGIASRKLGSIIIKSRFGGYDGRGNLTLDVPDWSKVEDFFPHPEALYAEKIILFQKELAVIVSRDADGNIKTYPTVETIHENNICHVVLAPTPIKQRLQQHVSEIAQETARHLGGAGVFAIEMFLTDDDEILVNEIAPRVHNSGHHTIEGNQTSQFEQQIRSIAGLPLGSTETVSPAAMINILGERNGPVEIEGLDHVLALPDTHVHLYGKKPTKVDRKMGHITVRARTIEEAKDLAEEARRRISI